jgi:hypothetical protein
MTIEEVDALTGPLIGNPRSATFRLADIVGLDVTGERGGQPARAAGDRRGEARLRPARGGAAAACRRATGREDRRGLLPPPEGRHHRGVRPERLRVPPAPEGEVPAPGRRWRSCPWRSDCRALVSHDSREGRFLWAAARGDAGLRRAARPRPRRRPHRDRPRRQVGLQPPSWVRSRLGTRWACARPSSAWSARGCPCPELAQQPAALRQDALLRDRGHGRHNGVCVAGRRASRPVPTRP